MIIAISSRHRLAPTARTTRDELTALESWAEQVIDAGADLIQLRESDWPAGVLTGLVRWVAARAGGSTTRVLVNDRADVALAAGAHGVHLPSSGLPAAVVRGLAADWIVGRSVHDGDDVTAADGVDYFLFGTVFPSLSKPGRQAAGVAALQRAAVVSPVPWSRLGASRPTGPVSVSTWELLEWPGSACFCRRGWKPRRWDRRGLSSCCAPPWRLRDRHPVGCRDLLE